tara:strand:+ start:2411 stop:3463 length:1053 start_codon:yes stop_codon:yes gene_type:complete
MIDKSKYICTTPFRYTDVFEDAQFLCCPGWLNFDVSDKGKTIRENFNSKKSQSIRESILDGSYKYCDENQCPHLSGLQQGKFVDNRLVPKNDTTIKEFKTISEIKSVGFSFDRSCNLACPSCRVDLINYLGEERKSVDIKLEELNNEISKTVKRLYLTGTADPFYSKSFRQFLIDFEPSNYPKIQTIHLHTNGILWSEKLWEKMKSIHPYVISCEISIDAATKDTYENKVRLGGEWDILMERLEFIINIPTIYNYCFSFVCQDSNYKEMYEFYKLIKNLNSNDDKIVNINFNHMLNWGTFSDKEYISKDISNPNHELHSDFLLELNKIHGKKNVFHNFNHLMPEIEKKLI